LFQHAGAANQQTLAQTITEIDLWWLPSASGLLCLWEVCLFDSMLALLVLLLALPGLLAGAWAPGHPCSEPALASKPFCDETLSTAERAAAMKESLAAMQAEYGPLPGSDLEDTAASPADPHNSAREAGQAEGPAKSTSSGADPDLDRLELTAGFGLGCVSACCAVLLTALRAAWRDGKLGKRDIQGTLAAAAATNVTADAGGTDTDDDDACSADDAGTAALLAELDDIIAGSSSGGSSGSGDRRGVDGGRSVGSGKAGTPGSSTTTAKHGKPGQIGPGRRRDKRVSAAGAAAAADPRRKRGKAAELRPSKLNEVRSLLESIDRVGANSSAQLSDDGQLWFMLIQKHSSPQ
jgi:hypothetical protein